MRVLVAPDKFKGTLTAPQAASAIAAGWRRSRPADQVDEVPIADGGEGTLDALLAGLGGSVRHADVAGPLGDRVRAPFGVVERAGRRIALVETAAASGLQLIDARRWDPARTTTGGTGELIRAASREGPDEILVLVGGSATVDGGVGMAAALGARFLDAKGRPIGPGGLAVLELATIDLRGTDRDVTRVRVVAATDVDNPLTGPNGAAPVFGPQKGATPDDVLVLDRALAHLAAVIERDLGIDVRGIPGGGAAGGLGAGLVAFLGARLRRGADVVMDAVRLDERLARSDVVVTGEGHVDASSLRGKAVGAVLERAGRVGVPVIVLAGDADVAPPGALVRTLVDASDPTTAVEEAQRVLEEVAGAAAADAAHPSCAG